MPGFGYRQVMSTIPKKRVLAYLLIAGGVTCLYLGARDLVTAAWGQRAEARTFEKAVNTVPVTAPVRARHLLRRGDPVAKLVIPRLDTDLYVVEGDQPEQLRLGPGHLKGTALPGEQGNCVIAGHRDTHFRILREIRKGDDIVLETGTGKYLYRVKNIRVVSPNDTEPLQPTPDSELNLITCYPFQYIGSAPRRYVVEARLAVSVSDAESAVVE